MPTVIDELIVSLGLDTSQLTEGELIAISSMRRLEQQARRTSQGLQQDVGTRLRGFFFAIEHPVAAAERALHNLATQGLAAGRQLTTGAQKGSESLNTLEAEGRRAGESVSAGAQAGMFGLGAMAAAALTAFAALKGIKGVMDEIRDTARSTELTGFAAGWAGVPVEWMSRLSIAAYQQTGVPREQTESFLVGLRGAVEAYRTSGLPTSGQLTGPLRTLSNFGIPFLSTLQDSNLSADQITQAITAQISDKMAQIASTQGLPAAIQFGQQIGSPQLLSQFLSQGWPQIQRQMQDAKTIEQTEEETKASHDLSVAEREAETATEKLYRALIVDLAPALIHVLGIITGWLKTVSGWLEGPSSEKHVDAAPRPGESWQQWHDRTGQALPGTLPDWIQKAFPWLPKGGPNPNDIPTPETNEGRSPTGGEIPSSRLAPGGRVQQALSYFESQGWTREQASGIVGRLYGESHLNPQASNDIGGGHKGIAQWDQNRWSQYLAWLKPGQDPNDFQNQLAFTQWELTHTESKAGDDIRSQSSAYDAGTAMEEYERANDPAFTRYAASLGQQISTIQTSPSGGVSSTIDNSRTTNNGGDVNVGPITVNGNADPYAIGGAVTDAVKRERLVSNFNTGQE